MAEETKLLEVICPPAVECGLPGDHLALRLDCAECHVVTADRVHPGGQQRLPSCLFVRLLGPHLHSEGSVSEVDGL